MIVMNCWWVHPEPEKQRWRQIQISSSSVNHFQVEHVYHKQESSPQATSNGEKKCQLTWWLDNNFSKILKINGRITGKQRVFFNSYENQSPTSGKTSFPYGAVVFPLRLGGESITQILHSPSLTWNPKTHGFPVGICYSRGGHFQVPCQPLGGSPNGLGRFCLNFRCHGSASKSTKAKAVYICKTDLYFFSIASNIRFKMMKPKNTSWVLLYFLCLSHVYIVDMHFKWQETRSQSLNCVGSKRPTAIIVAIHLCKGSLGGST